MDERIINKLYKRIGCLSDIDALTINYLKPDILKKYNGSKRDIGVKLRLFDINSKSRVSLLKNSTDILTSLENILNNSEFMYKNKAYWNYYKKYNDNIDELFVESYNTLYDCKNSYNEWQYDLWLKIITIHKIIYIFLII